MGTQYYRHPKFGRVYGNAMPTPTGRLAWPSLVEPRPAPPPKPGEQQGAPRYEVTIIIPKADEYSTKWLNALKTMTDEMLVLYNQGRKGKLSLEKILGDGDTWDHEKYPYYKDCWLITARNVKRPPLVNGRKQEIPADSFSGGMFVRGTVTPHIGAEGVSFKLEALQLVRDDGRRFAGSNRNADYVSMLPEVDDGDTEPAEAEVPAEETGKAKALSLL